MGSQDLFLHRLTGHGLVAGERTAPYLLTRSQFLAGPANITKETALSEKGTLVNGRGDKPNQHDILTGSRADGTAFSPFTDTTCKDWTSNDEGSAVVGHHDKIGPNDDNWSKSWNFAHQSKGCSEKKLQATGGAGFLYCFAE